MRDQRPPIGEWQDMKVARGSYPDRQPETIMYKREEDAWYVMTAAVDEAQPFAIPEARDRDVRQLINKKWNYNYGDPDDLDDF